MRIKITSEMNPYFHIHCKHILPFTSKIEKNNSKSLTIEKINMLLSFFYIYAIKSHL